MRQKMHAAAIASVNHAPHIHVCQVYYDFVELRETELPGRAAAADLSLIAV